jgi:hypothetical protein
MTRATTSRRADTPPVTHRVGRLWIRWAGVSTYDVMFTPTGNADLRITTEDGLRSLLGQAAVTPARIEEAVRALRTHREHEIPGVTLSLEGLRKLGL